MAFPINQGVSFSSSTRQWDYDVFLSFRSEDTCKDFTAHLYRALCDNGFNAYIDNDLQRGKEISVEILEVIKSSRISMVIFSQNYAFSSWCLEELVEILNCKKNGQLVLPIFYKVDPSEVRKQEGEFEVALAKHENKFKNSMEKVQRWRAALKEVANLSGWHYEDGGVEYKFIQQIIEYMSHTKLSGRQLFVAKYPVGVYSRAKAVASLLDIKENYVRIVGISGFAGIGKTTIAKAVYNRIFEHFEGSCFLENVRENSKTNDSMIQLQEKLLSNILREKHLKVGSVARGLNMIREMLQSKRVLLILDDVDKSKQIENILGECDWFASGSRVLITTRDKHLLDILGKDCKTYEMKELDKHEALELFNQHTFQGIKLVEDYFDLANQVIQYTGGLPLVLTIIGSGLCGRDQSEWKGAIHQYGKILNRDIYTILKVSYDGLEEREKEIFLNIACFFNGRNNNYVVNILDACNLYPRCGIPNLINKCLITIGHDGILWMHDLVQQTGREIVRQESLKILNERSRLWRYEDSLEVLRTTKGSNKIQGIKLDSPNPITVQLHAKAFKKLENLKFLMVRNVLISEKLKYLPNGLKLLEWPQYPFSLPSNYCPQQLVVLEMPHSCIRLEKLFKQGPQYKNLKRINLRKCLSITRLPDLCASNLEELDIGGCENLIEVHEAIGSLEKLKMWNLGECKKLQILPSSFRLKSLEFINLAGCVSLEKLPDLCAPNLESLDIGGCENLIEVHEAIGSLDKLKMWNLSECKKLQILPSSFRLKSLEFINLAGCVSLEKLPNLCAPNLESLDIAGCENLIEVHEAFGYLDKLKMWNLGECKKLQILPSSFRLKSLEFINLAGCVSLEKLPKLKKLFKKGSQYKDSIDLEEGSEGQIKLEPQGGVFDDEAIEMTSNSSEQMEFDSEEIGNEADRPEKARLFLMQGGLGLTEPPKDEDWEHAKVINLMDNELSVLPENPRCPKLSALFLKRNYKLRIIPPSFFDYMPALQILNLSRTGIKSLPDSIMKLVNLKRLFLNDCHCFMMLSPKVGELKQLEVLDLEGTEIMNLPQEIKKLTNLKCLEVSFCEYMSDGKQAIQSNAVVPCGIISELSQLEELNIDVNLDDERWDACLEDIVNEVCGLNRLETLKFYFPKVELLRQFLSNSPLLSHFRYTVGRHVKRIISRVPPDVEFELERWERCLIYINGEDVPGDIKKVLQHVTAFFLDRHATVKKLSSFGIRNMMQLKCLVMGECNEVQVIIDEADVYEEDDISKMVSDSYATEKIVLGSLEYLYIYYMKSLRSIWEGSVQQNSLILLRSLTLCTCPQLTIIFSQGLLANLCNLEELEVKDCPSVNSIVSCKIFSEDQASYFLPNLKKISLHYMTGLVSISSGLHIAPKLEWLSIYDCPKLKNPFDELSSQDLKKIKGERIWWEALEWSNGCPVYLDKIFVPIDDIWDC